MVSDGQPKWMYAYDHNKGMIVPALSTKFFKSGEVTKEVRVTLDNGKVIRTTPEHLYMRRNGSYVPASELKVGDSFA